MFIRPVSKHKEEKDLVGFLEPLWKLSVQNKYVFCQACSGIAVGVPSHLL